MSPSVHLAKTNKFCQKNHSQQQIPASRQKTKVAALWRTQETVPSVSQHSRVSSDGKNDSTESRNKCAVCDSLVRNTAKNSGLIHKTMLLDLGPLPPQKCPGQSRHQPSAPNQGLFIATKYSHSCGCQALSTGRGESSRATPLPLPTCSPTLAKADSCPPFPQFQSRGGRCSVNRGESTLQSFACWMASRSGSVPLRAARPSTAPGSRCPPGSRVLTHGWRLKARAYNDHKWQRQPRMTEKHPPVQVSLEQKTRS